MNLNPVNSVLIWEIFSMLHTCMWRMVLFLLGPSAFDKVYCIWMSDSVSRKWQKNTIRATMWEIISYDMCTQWRLKSACTVFFVLMKKLCILGYSKCARWRFWSDCANAQANQGLVVQSIFSLTSSLRVISLTLLADSIHSILIFFAEKMWVAFALQKLLTFFSAKNFSIFAYH